MATELPVGATPVPINLDSIRFLVGGQTVMAVNGNSILEDVPGASNKQFSFTLDPAEAYVDQRVIYKGDGVFVTYTDAPEKGRSDVSPNMPRNKFSGLFDVYRIFKVPA